MMHWQLLHGSAVDRLRELGPESVQCIVTSPPYWGLRDYGTATWDGGDPACDHKKPLADIGHIRHSTLDGGKKTNAAQIGGYVKTCGKCGARRIDNQLGLESTPDDYVASLVSVFRELRRVLRTDGTCWLNLGDSYAGSWGNQGRKPERGTQRDINGPMLTPVLDGRYPDRGSNTGAVPDGLKPKDLCGVPWRVAFALQADGWWLRSEIIWHKPNPMPESMTDRPTKAHEQIFLLTKCARYYYDAAAIREPYAPSTLREAKTGYTGTARKEYAAGLAQDPSETKRRVSESIRRRTGMVKEYEGKHASTKPQDAGRRMLLNVKAARDAGADHDNPFGQGANKRSVWTVVTQPYPEAHFATFPEALIEPCILAGSRSGDLVLDPFAGSGTTGVVALKHGRSFIGIDLNQAYLEMARRRLRKVAPLLAEELSA